MRQGGQAGRLELLLGPGAVTGMGFRVSLRCGRNMGGALTVYHAVRKAVAAV